MLIAVSSIGKIAYWGTIFLRIFLGNGFTSAYLSTCYGVLCGMLAGAFVVFTEGKEALSKVVTCYKATHSHYHRTVLNEPIRLPGENTDGKGCKNTICNDIAYNDIQCKAKCSQEAIALIFESKVLV